MKVDAARVLRRRHQERDDLLGRVREFAAVLPEALEVRAVAVFGSVARGDFNKWSDIDVLVIADRLPGGPLDRHDALGTVPAGIQPVVWTSGEFRDRHRRHDPIAVEAANVGVWVRGTPSHDR